MNFNCFNLQYNSVLIIYTEISNFNTFKLIYLIKKSIFKKKVPLTTIKIVQGGPKNGGGGGQFKSPHRIQSVGVCFYCRMYCWSPIDVHPKNIRKKTNIENKCQGNKSEPTTLEYLAYCITKILNNYKTIN